MLAVCTSSTDSQYTSTAAVALEIYGSTSASTSEFSRIDALITRASRWAESVLGYPLGRQVYTETVPGRGRQSLVVSRTPVTNVLALYPDPNTTAAEDSTSYRVEDADAGLIARDAGWEWNVGVKQALDLIVLPDYDIPTWRIEYGAGYVGLGGTTSTADGTTSTDRTLPEDIEQAVIMRAVELYGQASGVVSKKVDDLEIRFSESSGMSPAEALLAPYRRF